MKLHSRRVLVSTCAALMLAVGTVQIPLAAQELPGSTSSTAATGMVAAGADDHFENTTVSFENGTANWDWVRSFRDYVGFTNEQRSENLTVDEYNNSLIWPLKAGQTVDLNNLQTLQFEGAVHWSKYDGELDVTLKNPTIDFVKKRLLVDGSTKGTMARPGVAVDKTQTALLELTDLKAEYKDGYLLITSFLPRITDFSTDLVGFYEGEIRQPFVATIKVAGTEGEAPAPILWKLFPEKYDHLRPRNIVPDDPNLVERVLDIDPVLAGCVRWELDIDDPNTPITTKHMSRLTSLFCRGGDAEDAPRLRSLAGLEYADRLSRVRISNQRVEDLSPLAELKNITEIDISYNGLNEISSLGFQPKLLNLNAEHNNLVNIDKLATLDTLETLNLSHNKLFHLRGLPRETENLTELNVSNNELEDISNISKYLYLKEVDMSHNALSDIAPLTKIRGLREVDLSYNYISDFSGFSDHVSRGYFEKIKASHNSVADRSHFDFFGSILRDLPATGDMPLNDVEKPATKTAPTISEQPASTSAVAGAKAQFSVSAAGNPEPVIQWQRMEDGEWVNIPNAKDTTLEVIATDEPVQYRAAVRNPVDSVYSEPATLTPVHLPTAPVVEETTAEPPAPEGLSQRATQAISISAVISAVLFILGVLAQSLAPLWKQAGAFLKLFPRL
ncbi:HtaA domain-containing protein [Corynebacterium sp. HS2168-gen11]|uniref:HtaA domain-containing protein n=1 Tax=Corynebacterium sp. HS2168-gen11 TaxID=2974027 RepID=UPI00216B427B|nr:HtaA domain-containing protein [Corynebacterium sp. HS2168-gen11]MCS4536119.1 HtaA domain-containing protein [Corynebacterium sp. HS2168-gen11]